MWMQLSDKNFTGVRKTAVLAVFLGAAIVLGIVERMFPLEVAIPGVRLGLPNVVILILLYLFLPSDVIIVVILKCVLTTMFAGNLVSFAIGLTGSLLSFTVMSALIKTVSSRISQIGVSVVGSVFHNIGQILMAGCILGNSAVVVFLPALLISGVITGAVTGIAAKQLLSRIKAIDII